MFDLRFVERTVPAPVFGDNVEKTVKILQFRSILNPSEIGLQDPRWSEWSDVRTEYEYEPEPAKAAKKELNWNLI